MEAILNRYDIWNSAARRDPHTLYAQMRADAPIYRTIGPISGNVIWIFTRHEDCLNILKDSRFIKDAADIMTEEQRKRFAPRSAAEAALNRHMLNLDPPDHTRLRTLVHKAFTPRVMENLNTYIAETVTLLLDTIEISGDQEFDLIQRFAAPLPLIVIAKLLGIPNEDQERFRRWTKDILFGNDPLKSGQSALEAVAYFEDIFALRRAKPREDLLSALLAVEESGDHLSHPELLSMIFLLLVAGHETTVNLIANGMLALFQFPDQKALLIEKPGLIKSAVEEILRFHGPVENTLSRWAAEDMNYKGIFIQRGDIVMATLMSANRDPDVFENPDDFIITRDPNRHIAFGAGIHYCLGAPLARIEGTIAINQLLQRFPKVQLATTMDALVWNDQVVIRGMQALPVSI